MYPVDCLRFLSHHCSLQCLCQPLKGGVTGDLQILLFWVPESLEESAQIMLGVQKLNFNGLSLSIFWKNLKSLFTAIFLAKLLHPTLEDCSFMPHTSSFAVPLGYWRKCLRNQVPLRDSVFFFMLALLNTACPCRPLKLVLHTFAHSVFTYQNQKINTALAPL